MPPYKGNERRLHWDKGKEAGKWKLPFQGKLPGGQPSQIKGHDAMRDPPGHGPLGAERGVNWCKVLVLVKAQQGQGGDSNST